MTPRERVVVAYNHNEPDKVPIDLGGTTCSTLTYTANEKLKDYLNIKTKGELMICPLLESVLPPRNVQELFEVDVRTVRLKGPSSEKDEGKEKRGFGAENAVRTPPGHKFYDEYGTLWRKAIYDYAPVEFPLEHATVSDLKNYKWPDPYNLGRVKGLREEAKQMHEETDYAILSDIMCGGPFEQALWVRGFKQFMIDLASNHKFAQALLDKITEIDIGMWDAQLSQVGDYVDVVCQGDDLGMQTSLQLSPESYRKLVKPCHKRLFDFIHSKTKAKVFLHSCGSVYTVIPDLIENGVDILNPVQCTAKNMELEKLKKDFGKDITFWGGGISVQSLLGKSNKEIEDEVKKALETMAPGGGYVFGATHNILQETSGEQTYIAYMTAVKNRDYSKIKKGL